GHPRRVGDGGAALARRRLPPLRGPDVHRGRGGRGEMTAVRHSLDMTVRHLLALWRQPWFVAITLVQPIIWLLLYGFLFKRVVDIPGFHGGSYIEFLTPGIVVMSALFSAGWHGMGLINALEAGIMDRFIVSPL